MNEPLESRNLLAGYVPLAPTASPLWQTGYFAPAGTVDLSFAAAKAPNVAAGQAASLPRDVPITATGLPLLESRANGAGLEFFVDFARDVDGRGTFSLDGDRANFNAAEQLAIYNCWRELTGFFSQFNVNVTTVLPPTGGSDPVFAWLQVTNDFEGGAAYVNSLTKGGPTGTNNSGDAVYRVSGIAHEFGHILGLGHQSGWDRYGNVTAEYTNGLGYRNVPIMGIDYNGTPTSRFWYGRANWGSGSGVIQDDAQWIADKVASVVGGDGWRPDDFGNTIGSAYALAAGSQQLDAFNERYGDQDVFKITPTAAGPWNFTATPLYKSQAEPRLEVLDAAGNVVASRDDADFRNGPTNEQFLNVNLGAGTYYVRVTGGVDYDELGYYRFAATQLPTNFVSDDVGVPIVSGSVTYSGPAGALSTAGVFTQSGGGGDIWNSSDQFRFTYARLTGDGSITARVDSIENVEFYTKAGVMIRQSLAADSAHAFLGLLPNGAIDSIWRSGSGAGSANVNNAGSGPWVRISRAGNLFTFQASVDGATWSTLGTRTINMSGSALIGLATTAHSGRFEGFSTFSNVSVTGNTTPAGPTYNTLAAPTNVTAAPAAGQNTSIALSWSASAGATGYTIERSVNGVDFVALTTVAAGVTSYTDGNPWGSMRWFYRVRAANGTANLSAPSSVASAVNKPNAPVGTPDSYTAAYTSIDTGRIYLNWLDVQGETGYRIDATTDGANYSFVANTFASQTSLNVSGLTADRAYTFRITPLSAAGDGPAGFIAAQTRMGVVSNLRISSRSPTAMTIAWNDTTLETGTRIERSTDGVTWTWMGDAPQNAGTWTDGGITAGTEYYYRVMPFNAQFDGTMSAAVFAAAPAASLPVGWSEADIGNVAGGGAAVNTGTGAWTLVSGGNDVFGTADAFHFGYVTIAADATIVTRVAGLEATNAAAKAGLVIRQDLTAGSKSAAIMVNAGNGYGIDVRVRAAVNGGTSYQQALANVAAPYWLKLTRAGTNVIASYSADGVTFTTAATINLGLTGTAYLGLANTSFSATQLNTSTFDNVNVTVANTAPTVATAAAASPSPVAGTTTNLSVLGADDAGEATLTYTWASTGPAAVAFSRNGTNAAKTAIATFAKAGTYSFTVTIADAAGLTRTSTVAVNVNATPTAVTVSPTTATVAPGGQQQFAATVTDQFGAPISSPSVTWSVPSGGGAITTGGFYTAPATAGAATVRATSGAASADAAITVAAAEPAPTLTSFAVNGGVLQRSMVTSLTLDFSRPVSLGALAISLTRGGSAVGYVLTPGGGPSSRYVLTFSDSGVVGGSLADGIYTLTIDGMGVTGGDGAAMSGTSTHVFHRLFGDINGDGTVSNFDTARFRRASGSATGDFYYDAAFDYDGNGQISNLDLAQFRRREGIVYAY